MRGKLIVVALVVVATACGGSETASRPTVSSETQRFIPRSDEPAAAAPQPQCRPAPAGLIDTIDAAFTGGEHLEHAQAVGGSNGVTYIGGNIMDAAGEKLSSQDTWAFAGGDLYAMTSDARSRTGFPDGRDLPEHDFDWGQYNDIVSACVGDVERAENRAR